MGTGVLLADGTLDPSLAGDFGSFIVVDLVVRWHRRPLRTDSSQRAPFDVNGFDPFVHSSAVRPAQIAMLRRCAAPPCCTRFSWPPRRRSGTTSGGLEHGARHELGRPADARRDRRSAPGLLRGIAHCRRHRGRIRRRIGRRHRAVTWRGCREPGDRGADPAPVVAMPSCPPRSSSGCSAATSSGAPGGSTRLIYHVPGQAANARVSVSPASATASRSWPSASMLTTSRRARLAEQALHLRRPPRRGRPTEEAGDGRVERGPVGDDRARIGDAAGPQHRGELSAAACSWVGRDDDVPEAAHAVMSVRSAEASRWPASTSSLRGMSTNAACMLSSSAYWAASRNRAALAGAAHEDRRPAGRSRSRRVPRVDDLVVRARHGALPLGEHRPADAQRVLEALVALGERREVEAERACSSSNQAAPMPSSARPREITSSDGHLLREQRRVAIGDAGDQRAETGALGAARAMPRAACRPRTSRAPAGR